MTKIAQQIAAYRTAAGETQEALGALLGVTDKAISKWEAGQTEPNLDAVCKIAEHYGVSVDVMLGLEEKEEYQFFEDLEKIEDPVEGIQKIGSAAWDAVRRIYPLLTSLCESMKQKKLQKAVPPLKSPSDRVRVRINSSVAYAFSVSAPEMNLSLAQFQNETNFAWLKEQAETLASYFSMFSDPDGLRLIYALSRADFPNYCTAEYAAKAAGISVEKAESLLAQWEKKVGDDGFGVCSREAELCEGPVTLYEIVPTGLPLAMASLAYLSIHGADVNMWNHGNSGRMIYPEEENA